MLKQTTSSNKCAKKLDANKWDVVYDPAKEEPNEPDLIAQDSERED